jgi:uncharacterized repeat protein (TIGR01451 family)
VSGTATLGNLVLDTAGSYTIGATSTGLTGATSNSFTVSAAAANHLAFLQQPTNTTAGVVINPAVTVQILDAYNNLTSSTANVGVVANGPGAFTGGSTTMVAAVSGTATFGNLVLDTAGSYTIGATSTGLTGATSNSFTVSAAAPDHLAFLQQPSNTTAGVAISPAVTVQILDAFNNLTSSTANVGVVANGPGAFTGGSATTVAAVSGTATFSNLVLDTAGSYTIGASSTGLTGATSNSFTVSLPNSADLAVANSGPATSTEGDNASYTITVTNNGPLDAQSTVLTDTLGANLTFVSATTSQGTFSQLGGVVTFTLGTVANGQTVTATVTTQSTEDGNLSESASVTSGTPDPNPSNNSASATTAVAEGAITVSAPIQIFKSVSNVTVATFTHANGVEPASAFIATIDWGDGTSSQGTVTESGTTYSVVGSHKYQKGTNRGHTVTTTVVESGSAPNVVSPGGVPMGTQPGPVSPLMSTVSDGHGFTATGTETTVPVQAPASAGISTVSNQVSNLSNLNDGQKNILESTLQAAQKSLVQGNASTAVNQLGAFVNSVRAFRQAGLLDGMTADFWIGEIQTAINLLG